MRTKLHACVLSARAVLATLTAIVLLGCGTARRSEPLIGEHALTTPQLVLGRRVFDRWCHQCHPGGSGGVGLALNDKPLPEAAIELQVREGLGAMPAFSEQLIDDRELDALVDYVAWLGSLDVEIPEAD